MKLCLIFDLGYRGLLFASTKNLEAGPWFAGICYCPLYQRWVFQLTMLKSRIIIKSPSLFLSLSLKNGGRKIILLPSKEGKIRLAIDKENFLINAHYPILSKTVFD